MSYSTRIKAYTYVYSASQVVGNLKADDAVLVDDLGNGTLQIVDSGGKYFDKRASIDVNSRYIVRNTAFKDITGNTIRNLAKNDIVDCTGRDMPTINGDLYLPCRAWAMEKLLDGYVKLDDTDPYMHPNLTTCEICGSEPVGRLPADPEIAEALQAGRAAQYIDVYRLLGRHQINHNLCGEFSAAYACGGDAIGTAAIWIEANPSQKAIIEEDKATGVGDLIQMLQANFWTGTQRNYDSVNLCTPSRIITPCIAGCGITPAGDICAEGNIRHWVVVIQVEPCGTSAFVRVYNPMFGVESIIDWKDFMASNPTGGVVTVVV